MTLIDVRCLLQLENILLLRHLASFFAPGYKYFFHTDVFVQLSNLFLRWSGGTSAL